MGEAAKPTDPLLKAEKLIAHKRNDEAKTILLELEKQPSTGRARDSQVQFLLGLLDMADKDYDSAIARFRRILVSEPKNVRVRLEMGRAFFQEGRYADAERQFLYARAGKLPLAVLANVDRFLNAIRQLKTFSYSVSFAIAPDTNLNAGPATDTVSLYGLPFQLSPNAKANSGVGLSVDANVEWAPAIAKRAKWRVGGLLHRAQYRQTQFDDMTALFFTGPHLSLRRWDLNLLGNFSRRWYGDKGYATSYGPSADATYFVNPHLGVSLSGNLHRVDYDLNGLQNGLGSSATVGFFYTPTPASIVSGTAALGQQDAKIPAFAFNSRQFGLSYTREFVGGVTAGLSPSFTMIDYDAALAAFPLARRDRQDAIQVTLLDRKIDLHGLTPRLAYTYIRNNSNLELFTFRRSRFEIGFTSSF
jgi:outer membrane protein